jgi:hypothetical protein
MCMCVTLGGDLRETSLEHMLKVYPGLDVHHMMGMGTSTCVHGGYPRKIITVIDVFNLGHASCG